MTAEYAKGIDNITQRVQEGDTPPREITNMFKQLSRDFKEKAGCFPWEAGSKYSKSTIGFFRDLNAKFPTPIGSGQPAFAERLKREVKSSLEHV